MYVNPETDLFWLTDYRLFAPDGDGKTKLEHVADRLGQLAPRGIAYRTVLVDSWYATTPLFKWLLAAGKTFYYPLKSNRLVNDSGDQHSYQPVGCLCWSNEEVSQGKILKEKGTPKDCKLKRFRIRVSTHRTDDLLTNEVEPRETAAAEQDSSVRWTIEPFHRERKQLTGVQACQSRLAQSQRNHIALAVRAWTRLKQAAYQTKKTDYQLEQEFLNTYMRHGLIKPALAFA